MIMITLTKINYLRKKKYSSSSQVGNVETDIAKFAKSDANLSYRDRPWKLR